MKMRIFFNLDLKPHTEQPLTPILYCVLYYVIAPWIRDSVDYYCRTKNADLVLNYVHTFRDALVNSWSLPDSSKTFVIMTLTFTWCLIDRLAHQAEPNTVYPDC